MFYEIIGWIGTILVVTAYFMVSNDFISSQTMIYQIMNIAGATFLGVSVFKKGAYASFGLQIIWFAIGIIAIIKIIL